MTLSSWLGAQLSHPSGPLAGLVGRVMTLINAEPNNVALRALEAQDHEAILELGFGSGTTIASLSSAAPKAKVYGIDQSTQMVRQASIRNASAIREMRVNLTQGLFTDLPFADATFHKVLLVNVLYFFDEHGCCMNELLRVMKPGARAIVYVTDRGSMQAWPFARTGHHRLFDSAELCREIEETPRGDAVIVSLKKLHLPLGIIGLLATFEKLS